MQKLQCELCGSVDIVRTDDGFFQCQHCGCKYTLAQAKALLGTVETTIGTAELERLLNNAKTQYDLREDTEAEKTYTQITKQFPNDYRGWLGLMQLRMRYETCPNEFIVGNLIKWHKSCLKLAPNENVAKELTRDWINYWDNIAQNCASGEYDYIGSEYLELYADTSPAMYNYVKAGFDNAKILNSLGVYYDKKREQWELWSSKYHTDYYFWIGTVKVSPEYKDGTRFTTRDNKWLPPIDEKYISDIKADIQKDISYCIANKKCPYCKVALKKGLFETKLKCPDCGRKY